MVQNYTVVIFEDSEEDFFLIEHLFKSIQTSKYTIYRVQDIDEFNQLKLEKIDLIIMDYRLGADSGLDFIAQLKAEHGDFAPFIFFTGVDNPSLYDELRQLNVFDYFIKSEMTISLLERSCFYAIERFEAAARYNKEREFSKYLIENLDYFILEIDENGATKRSNEAYKQLRDSVLLLCPQTTQNNFQNALRTDAKTILFDFKVEDTIIHTKWRRITSEFSTNFTYIGEDISEEIEQRETEISRRKLESLGHLAGGIAHELNNTLQPIILRNDLLNEIGKEIGNSDITTHTHENKIMLNHGAAIISDILDFSNSQDNDQLDHDKSAHHLITQSLNFIERSLPDGIILNVDVDKNINEYHLSIGDNNMVKLLSNLLHNAAQSMNMNGVIQATFRISEKNMADAPSAQNMAITIKDSGKGMDKNVLKNIFSPFFTTRMPGKGTGLGMSVVHSIVEKLGGHIKIQSHIGKGTAIDIYIPMTPAQYAQP